MAPFPRPPQSNSARGIQFHKKSPFPPGIPLKSTKIRTLPTDGLDENYMTKWFCGKWFLTPTTEECYNQAISNLNKIDIVFLTNTLSRDLPYVAEMLGLNKSEQVGVVSLHEFIFL